jgi:uncharacterized protein YqjF (DUF2071 family)
MDLPLEMGWRHLLFENWPVDPALLEAHLPDALDADVHDGSAWLSVVPFTNVAVRPKGFPEQLGVPLPELNLRTYVTHDGIPGVYFFSLDAAGLAGVVGARLTHHLPYYYASTSLEWADGRVQFRSQRRHPGARPAGYQARYWPTGDPFPASEDPLGEFLVERYRLYTQDSSGAVRYTAVDHDAWTLYPAEADVSENTLLTAEGFAVPDASPEYFYSPGLDVAASPSTRVDSADD